MNIGIVAEYNPFHNGHLHHIKRTKEITGCDNIIAVMSGDFVQRGEPAAIQKFSRAQMALEQGVDLVIELPVVYATASAERFAYGAVRLLDTLGIIDRLSFGAETEDISKLSMAAQVLTEEPPEYKAALRAWLGKGISYPVARHRALKMIAGNGCNENFFEFLKHPNNILGIEYIKALNRLKSKIVPMAVKRERSDYNSTAIDDEICSAAAIRRAISVESNKTSVSAVMPQSAFELLMREMDTRGVASLNNFSDIFHYILATEPLKNLAAILDIDEGLENRLYACSELQYALSDILAAAKTKRYTMSRLRRAVLHILLQIRTVDADNYFSAPDAGYIRVLGFRKDKSDLLHMIKRRAHIPVLTRIRKEMRNLSPLCYNMLETELRATDLYQLSLDKKSGNRKKIDLYRHPVMI